MRPSPRVLVGLTCGAEVAQERRVQNLSGPVIPLKSEWVRCLWCGANHHQSWPASENHSGVDTGTEVRRSETEIQPFLDAAHTRTQPELRAYCDRKQHTALCAAQGRVTAQSGLLKRGRRNENHFYLCLAESSQSPRFRSKIIITASVRNESIL